MQWIGFQVLSLLEGEEPRVGNENRMLDSLEFLYSHYVKIVNLHGLLKLLNDRYYNITNQLSKWLYYRINIKLFPLFLIAFRNSSKRQLSSIRY